MDMQKNCVLILYMKIISEIIMVKGLLNYVYTIFFPLKTRCVELYFVKAYQFT